jgi:hypothetical protein
MVLPYSRPTALAAAIFTLLTMVTAASAQSAFASTTASALSNPAPATPANEPAVVRTVMEDDGARIEELRVRGEVQRITVRSKAGGTAYEVLPASGARDPSQGMAGTGQTAGRRVWNLLSF